ncbi:Fur family transcriptional regulator [Acuticoccus sp. I52.16.1]|uniref:Fur family transcriptional regulator n=1 Tax=Acuticoccus sp. I52.16.1 TaxID=2928472 RepID=UPI001FD03B22|nr:transcriptional repressor [Acuticoccus sp. I52.16.1]UOM33238.1 transcriptional repressor [Acuticoccus sp. I52.16.1]
MTHAAPPPTIGELERIALTVLRSATGPVGAYDVLGALRAARPTAAAPTAYRTLAKLIDKGLAHRLESLNAYVACCAEHDGTAPLFSICDDCGVVGELADPTVATHLAAAVQREGFEAEKQVIELHGRCAACRSA